MAKPVDRLDELLWQQKILKVALKEQQSLAETLPAFGYDAMPFEANIRRLNKRLKQVREELVSLGYESD